MRAPVTKETTHALLRIVAGLMLWQHGAQKLFGWLGGNAADSVRHRTGSRWLRPRRRVRIRRELLIGVSSRRILDDESSRGPRDLVRTR